ncbi:T-complex protein 1 subunit eta [Malassezia vespertilionis]|nr:T-complex protein 1 subunit eta [Malassezia vespertilionis]WFD08314.1 T-complex protein 1 subunit eta [Malassezia vespertilionis]
MAAMMRGNAGGRLGMMKPPVIVLKEGTDTSQGTGQLLSNIGACVSVMNTVASTLGPRGMDKMIVNDRGQATISNDGATIMKLLDIVHPAARALVDIARAQDAEVGDGTTSVVLFAGELLKQARPFIEEGVSPHVISRGFVRAAELAVEHIKEIAVRIDKSDPQQLHDLFLKCAGTAMSSKLIVSQRSFFANMAVDAVMSLDQQILNEKLIGIKMVPGGAMQDSLLIRGVAFKKTFAYAGFEQQPKVFANPPILCLNVELELKAEKDNAEVRIKEVSEYQAIVDAEWGIIYAKLDAIVKTGAKVVLSKLPIGDLATQYFADRDIFCAGRVPTDDIQRVVQAVGGSMQSTVTDIDPKVHLGTCEHFEERQIGGERFNLFTGCAGAKTATVVLRGGGEQVIAEIERSLHDAIMIVKRAIQNNDVVAGGGAIEMELSKYLRDFARTIQGKQQLIIAAYAKALECIPRQLADNAGFDATDLMSQLRMCHAQGHTWDGIDIRSEGIANNMETFVWEPSLIKINALSASVEATRMVLSVDETVNAQQSAQPQTGPPAPPGTAQRALRAGGRGGIPRR